jgi:hypothetical protein
MHDFLDKYSVVINISQWPFRRYQILFYLLTFSRFSSSKWQFDSIVVFFAIYASMFEALINIPSSKKTS